MNAREKRQALDPDFVLAAYRNGYFPMADSASGEISWYSPDPRAIIPLDSFKISRSLRQVIRKKKFEIRIDTAFEKVIRSCSKRDETWISEQIIETYTLLHVKGYAHSVESWLNEELVGGLYGVRIRGAFFGESMFNKVPNASKVALVHLVDILKRRGFSMLDAQFLSNHLVQFGTMEIPRSEYVQLLSEALDKNAGFP